MIEAKSCGGVVIHRGKILALYKSYKNRYEGWVLPKGTVEPGETHEQTALREVKEEADVRASIVKYVGKSQYNFTASLKERNFSWIQDTINSTKSTICSALQMRSRLLRRHIRNIWSLEVPDYGIGSRSISEECEDAIIKAA